MSPSSVSFRHFLWEGNDRHLNQSAVKSQRKTNYSWRILTSLTLLGRKEQRKITQLGKVKEIRHSFLKIIKAQIIIFIRHYGNMFQLNEINLFSNIVQKCYTFPRSLRTVGKTRPDVNSQTFFHLYSLIRRLQTQLQYQLINANNQVLLWNKTNPGMEFVS